MKYYNQNPGYGLCPECMTQMEKIDGKCKCPKCNGIISKLECKAIAIDLDGCIASYNNGWMGENVFGELIPNCKENIRNLKSMGYKIIIYTSRLATKELEKHLTDNGIYFDAINDNPWHEYKQPGDKRKVIADIYIDDRAITFRGNWDEIPKLVEKFKPWEMNNKRTRL